MALVVVDPVVEPVVAPVVVDPVVEPVVAPVVVDPVVEPVVALLVTGLPQTEPGNTHTLTCMPDESTAISHIRPGGHGLPFAQSGAQNDPGPNCAQVAPTPHSDGEMQSGQGFIPELVLPTFVESVAVLLVVPEVVPGPDAPVPELMPPDPLVVVPPFEHATIANTTDWPAHQRTRFVFQFLDIGDLCSGRSIVHIEASSRD